MSAQAERDAEIDVKTARRMAWHQPLLIRIAILLTFALLPLGIIAVAQTQRAVTTAQAAYQSSLIAQTARFVAPEQKAIDVAFGVARGLVAALEVADLDPATCSRLMQTVQTTDPRYLFVGFVDANGQSSCNTSDRSFDFSDNANSRRLFADPKSDVSFNPAGTASGASVVIVSEPVYDATGGHAGFVSLSFSGQSLVDARERIEIPVETIILTFNAQGDILTSDLPLADLEPYLPADRTLTDLVNQPRQLFSGDTAAGISRDFALVPILPGAAYALGIWEPSVPVIRGRPFAFATLLFPLLMWVVTLAVALGALHGQVVRPIRDLRRRMRSFADGRRLFQPGKMQGAPRELQEIDATFDTMVGKVIRDEADLENTVHERGVLLKEVHHRVKNNLQLMSSIINMQARRARTEEAHDALRGVQDRLNSLATVHRALYQAPDVAEVRVDALLADQIDKLAELARLQPGEIAIEKNFAPITLVPDQASPLTLLATEAFTNALKYIGPAASGRKSITLTMTQDRADPAGEITFMIVNSAEAAATESGPGLGLQLIQAFSRQLGGSVETGRDGDTHYLTLRFMPEEFRPEPIGT